MTEKLRPLAGSRVQAAGPLESIEGILVSASDEELTLRVSGEPGYENGRHVVLQTKFIAYIRIVAD